MHLGCHWPQWRKLWRGRQRHAWKWAGGLPGPGAGKDDGPFDAAAAECWWWPMERSEKGQWGRNGMEGWGDDGEEKKGESWPPAAELSWVVFRFQIEKTGTRVRAFYARGRPCRRARLWSDSLGKRTGGKKHSSDSSGSALSFPQLAFGSVCVHVGVRCINLPPCYFLRKKKDTTNLLN